MAPTLSRGSREANGSCKTICISPHGAERPLIEGAQVRAVELDPSGGRLDEAQDGASVVLPQPDSPTMPSVSPRLTVKLTRRRHGLRSCRRATGSAWRAHRHAQLGHHTGFQQAVPWPGTTGSRGGISARHWSRARAARGEVAARAALAGSRHHAGDRCQHRALVPAGATTTAGLWCTGRVAVERADARSLDNAPRIHHQDALAGLGDDAEVVGDQQHRHADLAAAALISSRICACTVTSSAVVGSSAISSAGPQAIAIAMTTLAQATRQLVVLAGAPFGRADADEAEKLEHLGARRCPAHAAGFLSTSAIWKPTL